MFNFGGYIIIVNLVSERLSSGKVVGSEEKLRISLVVLCRCVISFWCCPGGSVTQFMRKWCVSKHNIVLAVNSSSAWPFLLTYMSFAKATNIVRGSPPPRSSLCIEVA